MNIAAGRKFYDQFGKQAEAVCPVIRWSLFEQDGSWTNPPDNVEVAVLIADAYCDQFKDAILQSSALRWVHTENTGTDGPFYQQVIDKGLLLTRSPGANAPEVTEFVFAAILMMKKRLVEFAKNQRQHLWKRMELGSLAENTILVIGLGAVGSGVARIANAFGMHVLGIRKSSRPDPNTDELGTLEDLPAFLCQADIIVLALPFSQATKNLISEEQFRAMPDNCLLVNVARGEIVDIEALKKYLLERKSLRAVLDVMPMEPWPADDDIWDYDNVLITPHIAWSSPLYRPRAVRTWLENLALYMKNTPLKHLVIP